MAKIVVILLFFLFAISHARFSSDATENDVIIDDPNRLPDSDPRIASSILLPSEKPESEPATIAELEPETTVKPEISASTESETETVPLTVISFRPINRHFPRRPMLQISRRHNCRHGHREIKPWGGPRFHNREVPYGNDMIMSGGEDFGFDPAFRGGGGGVRQVPAKWVRFNHGRARFPFKHEDADDDFMEGMKKHHHHHHHGHHREVEGEEKEREEEEEHEVGHHHHDHGFMGKIRKFLDHF